MGLVAKTVINRNNNLKIKMRKLILMMVLTGLSSSAMAEWTRAGHNDDSIAYVDLSTIRKHGDLVKMWYLDDFKKPQIDDKGDKYLSSKGQGEYDCKEEQLRTLAYLWFSDNMEKGELVHSGPSKFQQWNPVPPGSIAEIKWQIACGILKH